ncbi:MAG: hypothetical protein JO265_09960 [Acidimicrobiia bacterium]|nr:hypothetical protein [Acidimicrobiia bacterium]
MWRVLEPYHAVTYFADESRQGFRDIGLRGFWMGYFAGRSAPMGPVGPGVVTATFYGFRHSMVARALPDAWTFASVTDVLAARMRGVDLALRRLLGEAIHHPALAQAAGLARAAAEAGDGAGRPIYAANRDLPWPAEPHLILWQACTLLREHRGDGHVVALTAAGLDGCESHVSLVASGALTREVLQPNRGWTDGEWDAATGRLQERGWLGEDGAMTDAGRAAHHELERHTDELALVPWQALSDDAATRLGELATPFVRRIVLGGAFPVPNPIGVPSS